MVTQTVFNMASKGTSLLDGVISGEDFTLIAKYLKDEKFRALLTDYAKEVNDPQNRKQFEREVKELERERGVEATFIHPSPGFSLAIGGDQFVNICSSDVVQRPGFQPVEERGKKGQKLSIPHAIPKSRRELIRRRGGKVDLDDPEFNPKTRNLGSDLRQALVQDVVFHPEALLLASQFPVVKKTLIDVALKSCHLKSTDVKELEDTDYVGVPVDSVMKRVVDQKRFEASEVEKMHKDHRTSSGEKIEVTETKVSVVKPMYKMKYVRKSDLQDYAVQLIPQCGPAWHPQALEVEVSLPGVSRASQVDANVWHQSVVLTTDSTPKYKLELPLPYPVDEDSSAAKFDVATQKLTLTLRVVSVGKVPLHGHSPPSDSGIECELDFRTSCDDSVSVSSQEDSAKEGVEGTTEEDGEDSVFDPPLPERKMSLMPNYSIAQTKDTLCVTLHCGNVLPSSIKVQLEDESTACIELSSIGGGQTLLHYSLRVVSSPHQLDAASGLGVEVREGKVEVVARKEHPGHWDACRISHGDNLTYVTLPPITAPQVAIKSESEPTTPEKQNESKSCVGGVSRTPRMARTVSMCETGTSAGQPFRLRGPTCSWPRGILKHRTRSLSESQVGAFSSSLPLGSASSSLDLETLADKQTDAEEEEEESAAESLGEKKSVRFNEVVSRQLFRSNSSILGQRAKNQRKAMRKRRSQERRGSDSGLNTTGSISGSDLVTTDDDTDATTTDTTEVDDDVLLDDAQSEDIENNNNNGDTKTPTEDDNNMNSKNNNSKTISTEEEDINTGFIVKTSKKKKRKNRKNKLPSFEPSNNLIFQLDMDK